MKNNIKPLVIGYICQYKKDFDGFKYSNPDHEIIWLNQIEHLDGHRFDLILKGPGWGNCDSYFLNIYKEKVYYRNDKI